MMHLLRHFAAGPIAPGDVPLPQQDLTSASIGGALQVTFGVAGGIAIIIVALGALKYITSQGNPQETARAKDTILYALIGLVICATAFSIVTFVVVRV